MASPLGLEVVMYSDAHLECNMLEGEIVVRRVYGIAPLRQSAHQSFEEGSRFVPIELEASPRHEVQYLSPDVVGISGVFSKVLAIVGDPPCVPLTRHGALDQSCRLGVLEFGDCVCSNEELFKILG